MTKVNLDKMQAKGNGNIVSVVSEDKVLPNGAVVALGELVDGERELFKATTPEEGQELLLVAAPEVKYNESEDQLDFETEAGHPVRAYHLYRGDIVTVELALFDATPSAGDVVTGNAEHGYTVGEGKTQFKVERVGKYFFDRRDVAVLRVL